MFLNPGIIPNYLIVSELGLLDSVWALVLPNAIWTFELLILKSFYENMSESLREATVVDGASEYRILFQIVLPLSKPALASIGLFYFMGHWNSFFIPLIYLNDANMYPLQVVLRDMLIFSEKRQPESGGCVGACSASHEECNHRAVDDSGLADLSVCPEVFCQRGHAWFREGITGGDEGFHVEYEGMTSKRGESV